MSHFRCWVPDYGHSPVEDGDLIKKPWANAGDAGDAATLYAEQNFARWEYPSEIEIAVQEIGDSGLPVGRARVFVVRSEPHPVFFATEKR